MKTVCILIGFLSLYYDVQFLGHPAGMHHALESIIPAADYHHQDA